MNKLLFVITSGVATIVVLLAFFLFSRLNNPQDKNTPAVTPFPTVTGAQIPMGDKLEISNIEVDNFYSEAARIDSQRNVYIVDDRQRYQILYEEQYNLFLISILDSPFQDLRLEAEQKLISELGVTEADACFLNVQITTPAFANPDFSGKAHTLSFCE